MPLISIAGRKIVESGSVTLGNQETEAVLQIGPLNLNMSIDMSLDTSIPTKATASGQNINVVFPRVLTSQVVYWKANVSGGGKTYDVTVIARGMDKDSIQAHTLDFTVSES